MSEQSTPSEQPYDPAQDPDADPAMLEQVSGPASPAEGDDDATAASSSTG